MYDLLKNRKLGCMWSDVMEPQNWKSFRTHSNIEWETTKQISVVDRAFSCDLIRSSHKRRTLEKGRTHAWGSQTKPNETVLHSKEYTRTTFTVLGRVVDQQSEHLTSPKTSGVFGAHTTNNFVYKIGDVSRACSHVSAV